MKKHVLVLTMSALILVCGPIAASAQQGHGTPTMQQPDQQQPASPRPEARMSGQGGMMGRGMMGRGMMGQGGMMGRGMMGEEAPSLCASSLL